MIDISTDDQNIKFSKIAYFGTPFLSHVLPFLKLFRKLNDNYGIDMYNSKTFTKEFNYYFNNIFYLESTVDINYSNDIYLTFFKICIPTYEEITNLWDKHSYVPSIIISDQAATYAPFIAKKYNIPCFSLISSFPLDEESLDRFSKNFLNNFNNKDTKINQFNIIIQQIENKFGIKVKRTLSGHPNHFLLGLNDISISLVPHGYCFKTPINILCFGPMFRDIGSLDFDFETYKNNKVIFVSLGTLIKQSKDFYKNIILCCLKYFQYKAIFLISICNEKTINEIFEEFQEQKLETKGIIIKPYWNQLKVLKHSDLFISHCGYGSYQESIYYKVPILAYPLKSDQFFIAEEIKRLNIGKILPNSFNEDILYNNISQLLEKKNYKKNIEKYSSLMNPAETISKYIKLIDKLINTDNQ